MFLKYELFDQLTYETKIQLAKAMQSENRVTVVENI